MTNDKPKRIEKKVDQARAKAEMETTAWAHTLLKPLIDKARKAEIEKAARVEYQDIVYAVCNIVDRETGAGMIDKCTVDTVVDKLVEVLHTLRKRSEPVKVVCSLCGDAADTVSGVVPGKWAAVWNETRKENVFMCEVCRAKVK